MSFFFPSMAAKTTTFFFFLLLFHSLNFQCSSSENLIRGGYWLSVSALPVSEINSALFTHLMFAFAHINSSTYHIYVNSTYEQSFSNFTNAVKRKNPSVKTLLSIRGGKKQDSAIFSSMIKQSSSRQSFIQSSIETARVYGFDGLELSGVVPENNTSMINLGTLLDEWRAAVASESINSSKSELLLAMTVYNFSATGSMSYPVESVKKSLDWVNVLAFDYYLPTRDNFTGPHSALYGSSSWFNTNKSVQELLDRGFLPTKLVLCMPFHGYVWSLVNPNDNTVGAPASGPGITIDGSMGYKFIKAYIKDYGYGAASVYNDTFSVNFFTRGQTWINFDSVEAIRAKVSFAKERGLLGYSVFQLANDDNWELSIAAREGGEDQKNQRLLLIIILVTVAVAVLLLGTMVCCFKRKVLKSRGVVRTVKKSLSKMKNKIPATENLNSNAHNLLVLSFTTIKEATDNFSSANKIGEGGYGPVYKGRLPKGQEVAVKRLSKFSNQGQEEFRNEVKLTARLQHVNLVPVLGICTEREEKMLIYELMPNKSLDFYIFDPHRRHLLDWRKRVHIIEGIIQGLLYLQEYSNFTIIHRDLKASNILLDGEMNPKISDFGMAKAFAKDECEANTRRIVGTYGYVPPEYVRKGIYSMKYDVYSFGVLLLQIISGKRTACYYGPNDNFNLLEFAYELWKDGEGKQFFDSSLEDSSSSTWKLMRCMQVALLCVQEKPADRPTMLEVFNILKNETAAITTPKKPAFSIKRDEDEESECILKVKKCSISDASINDASITELVAR